jgi:hypothetical protein
MSHDPIDDAFKALHTQNLLAARDAQIKQLKDADHTAFWSKACKDAEDRCANQAETIQAMRYAGNELARVMEDILGSDMITCQISRAVMTSTIAKWREARFRK